MQAPEQAPRIDYRFSMANERTFLAWIRTGLALVAGGVAAAKAVEFDHELLRWTISLPPILIGVACLAASARRLRRYEEAMDVGRALPGGRAPEVLVACLVVYVAAVLLALVLD